MKLFITDYASYNDGSQFEFGHWLDISDMDYKEFQEYIVNHFKECDLISPLCSPREELMITDIENIPSELYCEFSAKDIFRFKQWLNDHGYNFGDENDIVSIYNQLNVEDMVYSMDEIEEHIAMMTPLDAFKLGKNSFFNWSDEYFKYDGYGNIESLTKNNNYVDKDSLVNKILEVA